jgi:hypothetical protein
MKYKVHKLDIKTNKESDRLEQFLNNLDGEVIAVIPNVTSLFLCYGSKVNSVLVIEKVK